MSRSGPWWSAKGRVQVATVLAGHNPLKLAALLAGDVHGHSGHAHTRRHMDGSQCGPTADEHSLFLFRLFSSTGPSARSARDLAAARGGDDELAPPPSTRHGNTRS